MDLVNSTTADVTFTAATGFSFIDSSVADVQVNAGTWTVTNLSTNGSGATLTNGGSGNVDGFGVFNQTFNQTDGFADRATTISFTLTNTSSTWASNSNVLAFNASGFDAAAHIAVNSTGGATTGFAAEGVPEPGTLLGAGVVTLMGLGYTWRRRRQATA